MQFASERKAEPVGALLHTIRIRFSGNPETDTFQLDTGEYQRLLSDWKSYLNGLGARGGEYTSQVGDRSVQLSLNFTQMAYTEPCKS
jgi:hypothetical protein